MVACVTALGNYDPSLYFPERVGAVSGKRVGGGYGPSGRSAFADGGG